MNSKNRTGKHAMAMPSGTLYGVCISMIMTMVGCGILAWVVINGWLREEMTGYGSMIILLTASAVGCIFAYKKVQRRKLLICLLTGAGYYILLLACTALFFGGQFSGVGVTALVIAAGAISVGLMRRNAGRVDKIGRRKMYSS